MPEEFELIRKKIKAQLKKDNSNISEEELESRSYAIATSTWKKSHGGKAPEKANWHLIEFCMPIIEFSQNEKDFMIKGIAISETTTHNGHKYIAEELEKAAPSLIGRPLLIDHKNEVEAIKGKIIYSFYDPAKKNIQFEAKVMDEKIREMITDGRIDKVSIGAFAEDLIQEDGNLIAKGIKIAELSLVAVPADENASFGIAMQANYNLREIINNQTIERRFKMTEENTQEMDELKNQLNEMNQLKSELTQLKNEKRKNLEESYKQLCRQKNMKEKDISKASDDSINLLMEQLNDIIEERKEFKSMIVEESNDTNDFIVERSGKGYSLWAMPDQRGVINRKW